MRDDVKETALLVTRITDQIEVGVQGIVGTLHIPNGHELVIRVENGEAKVFYNTIQTN